MKQCQNENCFATALCRACTADVTCKNKHPLAHLLQKKSAYVLCSVATVLDVAVANIHVDSQLKNSGSSSLYMAFDMCFLILN